MSSAGLAVIAKAGLLLRALGAVGGAGSDTTSLARLTGLTRPTAYRLLCDLAEQGLVERDMGRRRWLLGPELYLLGVTASTRYDITEHARDILADLADQSGESAFLSVVRGRDTVCLVEVEGSFPVRSHVLYEGIRLPLGVASAGLATLAHLPTDEAAAYLAGTDLTVRWGRSHSRRAVRARVDATRRRGFAVNPGLLVEGSWGIGVAVFDRTGRPRWALSLTGVESRFTEKRVPRLGQLLLQQAHTLSKRLLYSGM